MSDFTKWLKDIGGLPPSVLNKEGMADLRRLFDDGCSPRKAFHILLYGSIKDLRPDQRRD